MAVEVAYLHSGLRGDFWVWRRPLLMLPWSWKMNSLWLHTVSSFQRPDPSSGIFLTTHLYKFPSSSGNSCPLMVKASSCDLCCNDSVQHHLCSRSFHIEGIQTIALYGTYIFVSLWQSLCIFNHTFGRLPNWSLFQDTPLCLLMQVLLLHILPHNMHIINRPGVAGLFYKQLRYSLIN